MPRTKLRRYFRHGLLPQLIVFEAVARLGSVTRAAEELHLAQPTVSTQIKKLAATFEVALFQQRGRRLHLTVAGQALRESCVEMLALFARTEERLAALRGATPEVLRLAAEPEARAVAARLLAGLLLAPSGRAGEPAHRAARGAPAAALRRDGRRVPLRARDRTACRASDAGA
jgi:DNA-binding transcriptional LysR family regulator